MFQHVGAPLLRTLPVHHRCSSSRRSRCCASALRDARTADDAAAGQARPARGYGARLRRAGRHAGGVSSARWASRCSGSTPRTARGSSRCSRSANALLGMSLGLFVSAFAQHRVPGRSVHAGDRLAAAPALRPVRRARRDGAAPAVGRLAFPLTYAFDALSRATHAGPLGATFVVDVAVVIGSTLAALALGAATLRRRTP